MQEKIKYQFFQGRKFADAVSLKNIIITGSHGKTTTTSLVAKIYQIKN